MYSGRVPSAAVPIFDGVMVYLFGLRRDRGGRNHRDSGYDSAQELTTRGSLMTKSREKLIGIGVLVATAVIIVGSL